MTIAAVHVQMQHVRVARRRAGNKGRADRLVPALAGLVRSAGLVSLVAGVSSWFAIRSQLAAEKITVPASAARFAGRAVRGPLAAYEQADFIKRSALKATGGKTYGELGEGDPGAEMAMEASLLRASLFTSILSFGVAAMQAGLGVVLIAVGEALRRVGADLRPRHRRL